MKYSGSRYDFVSSLDGELLPTAVGTTTSFSTKADSGDFRIYAFTNNQWTVTDKQGTTYKFGTSTGSRQNDTASTTRIYKWLLDEIRDTNGNYIKYTYYKDAGQIYPSTILYTGNGSTDGIFEVSFSRETRTDNATTSLPAFTVKTNYRINEIQAKVNGTWVRKYALAYTTGDNGTRSLLSSITETGQGEDATTITLPATSFSYQPSQHSIATSTAWTIPEYIADLNNDTGVRFADVNGDGLNDLIRLHTTAGGDTTKVYLNKGDGTGWATSTTWAIPAGVFFAGSADTGTRFAEVNGDGLLDIVQSQYPSTNKVFLNTGSGWTASTTLSLPDYFVGNGADWGLRVVDLNGDGLSDLVRSQYVSAISIWTGVWLNTGSGWATSTTWTIPEYILNQNTDQGVRFADVNGDGLVDFLRSHLDAGNSTKKVYLNKGDGTGWTYDATWSIPEHFAASADTGVRIDDINSDGLADIVLADGTSGGQRKIYINTGSGWSYVSSWNVPDVFTTNGADQGTRMVDLNGDGWTDFIRNQYVSVSTTWSGVWLNAGKKPDLLSQVTKSEGGKITASYKTTAQYKSGSTLLNPKTPFLIDTLFTKTTDDAFGIIATTTYSYEGGEYYFNNPYDRQFAGFSKIITTDPSGAITTTFYHQGNTSDSSHGEYSDHIAKAGKPYRIEQSDSSGNIFTKTINKWDRYDQGNGRSFVKLAQTLTQNYDGDSDHKGKAEAYTWSNTNGNLTQKVEYGEVAGSDDGTFTDTGSNKFTTDISYASGGSVIGLPSTETTNNQSSSKVKESRHYYDSQSLGTVTKGNETKTEGWKTSSSYASTTKAYDATYGLVTQEKDGKGNATNYAYDFYNLFVATSTNPLSQTRAFQYDYSSGKVKQLTDENNRTSVNVYDALDRVKEEKQPDQTTPSTLVTKALYTYTDTAGSRKVQKSNYLDGSNIVDEYTYLDGLDRPIQKRKESETSNTFAVSDFAYNSRGLLDKESLPYFGTGTSRSTATTTSALFTTYTYDALGRITLASNAAGNTSNAYDQWTTTVTDANGKTKDLTRDAYGNLVTVVEHNGGANYTTSYEWDRNGGLTKVADASGNIRNFTYDGLGRRLTAQDLHASFDLSYGTYTFTYDDQGNMTQKVDPKSQTVNYTYDALNRPLTEDYTGAGGTEITYAYDTCTDGKTHLCSVTESAVTTTRKYNPLGLLQTETKTINGSVYTATTTYDRLGNQTLVSYPDTSEARYTYNNAGLVDKVEQRDGTGLSFRDIVKSIDYNPLGLETVLVSANGATTTNAYDAGKLYRLSNRTTILPDMTGDQGSGSGALTMMALGGGSTGKQNLPGSMKRTGETEGSWKDEKKNPMGETFYVNTAKPDVLKPVSSAERTSRKALKSTASMPTPQAYFPTAYGDTMRAAHGGGKSGGGTVTTLAGIAPTESDNMWTQNLWLSETLTYNDSIEDASNHWDFFGTYATRTQDCTTSYSGSCSEKVVVSTSTVSWDPTLSQTLRIDPGINYILKFKAKSLATTTFEFSVGQNHDPWSEYGLGKYSAPISPQWKEYEYRFTSSATTTDENARIYLGLGAHATTYWFDDVDLIPDPFTKSIDPGFESASSMWQFWSAGGATQATGAIDCTASKSGDCSYKVHVLQNDSMWNTALYQVQPLVNGQTYVLTFDAKASVAQQGAVVLQQNHDPYDWLSTEAYFSLYPEWNSYVIEMTPGATDSLGEFTFYLGERAADIRVDNVKFWKKTNTKITTATPKFNEIFDDPDTSDTASAHQVQVIAKGGTFSSPLWDSGKTTLSPQTAEGARTASSTYAGPTLSLGDGWKYLWRVKLWDNTDNASPWTNGRDYFTTSGDRVQDLSYTYDNLGNITKITDASNTKTEKTVAYIYDDLSRLTNASTTNAVTTNFNESYAYDAIGNFTSKTGAGGYGYSGTGNANPHAATSIGATTLTYDNNGNMTAGLGGLAVAWDYRNRVASTTKSGMSTVYTYDYTNNRVQTAITTGTSTSYTHYPSDLYNITGPTPIKHIFVNGHMVATVKGGWGNGEIYYDHTDHLTGNNVTSHANGHVAELTDYLPYGSIRTDDRIGGYNEQRKFAGTEYDSQTALNYMKERYYDSVPGRFLSEDPVFLWLGDTERIKSFGANPSDVLSNPQFQNSYSYAANNPLKYVDKQGKFIDTVIDLAAIAYSSYKLGQAIVNGGDVRGETINLGLDAGGVFIPGVAGLGTLRRAANVAEGAKDGARVGKAVSSSVNLTGKQIKEISSTIASGHAYEKHIDEFKSIGIETLKDFQSHVSQIIKNPSEVRQLKDGRSAYWDNKTASVVIHDPKSRDLGTALRPTDGKGYFDKLK